MSKSKIRQEYLDKMRKLALYHQEPNVLNAILGHYFHKRKVVPPCGTQIGDTYVFTIREISKLLKVQYDTVREWLLTCKLRCIKLGYQKFVLENDLLEFLEKRLDNSIDS